MRSFPMVQEMQIIILAMKIELQFCKRWMDPYRDVHFEGFNNRSVLRCDGAGTFLGIIPPELYNHSFLTHNPCLPREFDHAPAKNSCVPTTVKSNLDLIFKFYV
jgi:hypothetical protein